MTKKLAVILLALIMAVSCATSARVSMETEWLTEQERIFGLSLIWRRAAEMSPFISVLPEGADWDALFLEHIPKVANAADMVEYYEILNRFVARLADGKSSVQFPASITPYVFPLNVRYIDSRFIVLGANPNFTGIPLGSEIVRVNGIPANDFLESNFGDLFSNRTPVVRQNSLAQHFTSALRQRTMTLDAVTPDGSAMRETASFLPLSEDLFAAFNEMNWLQAQQPGGSAIPLAHGATAMAFDEGIHHIRILTFANPELPEAVRQYIESVAGAARGFILDVRGNGGGTSDILILSQFADPRQFPVVRAYRQVRDAGLMGFAASLVGAEIMGMTVPDGLWEITAHGRTVSQGLDMLESRHLEPLYDFGGADMWDPDLLYQRSLRLFDIPVVILADHGSASAAETFVLAAQGVNNFTVMGTNTTGMAGDTPPFLLPAAAFWV